MRVIKYFFLSLFILSSCYKFEWHNPYDPECPKELFTPNSLAAKMEGNSVQLNWSQQNDNISGFVLLRSAEGEPITTLIETQKSVTRYIDANITPGKKYTYYVLTIAGNNKSDTVKTDITPVFFATVVTGNFSELSVTRVKVSGDVTNSGGSIVTARGVCWSTTPGPTINNSRTLEGTGDGQFISNLENLLSGTKYYARAYAENSRGVSYGTEISFTTNLLIGDNRLTGFPIRLIMTPSTIPVDTSSWTYIAIVKTSTNTGKVYKNGKLVATGNFQDASYSWSRLDIGAEFFTSYNQFFKGSVDEVRISNKERTALEISNSFDSNLPFINDVNTIGLWHFDESQGAAISSVVGPQGNAVNPFWSNGRFGNSIYYNGVTTRSSMSLSIPVSNVTLEFWFKPDGFQDTRSVISCYGFNTVSFKLFDTL